MNGVGKHSYQMVEQPYPLYPWQSGSYELPVKAICGYLEYLYGRAWHGDKPPNVQLFQYLTVVKVPRTCTCRYKIPAWASSSPANSLQWNHIAIQSQSGQFCGIIEGVHWTTISWYIMSCSQEQNHGWEDNWGMGTGSDCGPVSTAMTLEWDKMCYVQPADHDSDSSLGLYWWEKILFRSFVIGRRP